MTNKNKTTLYIGVTSNLQRRVWEHRTHYNSQSFTAKYKLECCIYYEYFADVEQAINRETQLKKWNRVKKENLISTVNPVWEDLWKDIKRMVI
ncbi:MAG: GIY-YIG nuclease family protein [Prevotellaceae bacterium]|nr:GIY-YIG nuclease family protein [Prevotellaceae bacterium]